METIIANVREGNWQAVTRWIDAPENDVDVGDEHRFSLLHWAAREGQLDIVRILLNHGARVNVTNDGDDTPLHLAAAHGHLDVVKLLLEHPFYFNAPVDAGNQYGNTPLHYACFWGYYLVIDKLVSVGASLIHKNDAMLTPLDVAPRKIAERIKTDKNIDFLQATQDSVQIPVRKDICTETLAKDPALFRADESFWNPEKVEGVQAIYEDNNYTYYRAQILGTAILVKMLETNTLTERQKRDIRDEVSRLRIFNHKNIMPVLGFMTPQKRNESMHKFCLFTENMDFSTLYQVLHSDMTNEISFQQGLKFAADICRGLIFLHSPELKVTDFRLNSKHVMVGHDLSRLFITGVDEFDTMPEKRHLHDRQYLMARVNLADSAFSTVFKAREYDPAWMSPEALKCKPNEINVQASDVWSFGVIIWEIASGCVPFGSLDPMVAGLQIATETLRLPPLMDSMMDRMNRIFKLCTNNEPKNRPRFDMILPILEKMTLREQFSDRPNQAY